jgi:hypothetical protein
MCSFESCEATSSVCGGCSRLCKAISDSATTLPPSRSKSTRHPFIRSIKLTRPSNDANISFLHVAVIDRADHRVADAVNCCQEICGTEICKLCVTGMGQSLRPASWTHHTIKLLLYNTRHQCPVLHDTCSPELAYTQWSGRLAGSNTSWRRSNTSTSRPFESPPCQCTGPGLFLPLAAYPPPLHALCAVISSRIHSGSSSAPPLEEVTRTCARLVLVLLPPPLP